MLLVITQVFPAPNVTWNVSKRNGLTFQTTIINRRALKEVNSKTTDFLNLVETKARRASTTSLSSIVAPVRKIDRTARAQIEIKALETIETISLGSLIPLAVIAIKDLKKTTKSIRTSFRDCISETLTWMEAQVTAISTTSRRKD